MSRGAPRVVATSDVTRFRGVAVAAMVAAATAGVLVVLWSPSTRGGAPGPLSAGHRAANVTCGGCHTAGTHAAPPAAACVTCHGAHPSRRPGHATLRANGVMTCATCHGGHRGHGSVTFFPDGRARRDDPAGAREIAGSPDIMGGFRPARPITVPLVEVAACARCHDAERGPLASCAIGGAGGVSGCFDEHTAIRGVDGAIVGRDLAWDAAREVARAMPPRTARPPQGTGAPWWWIGAAGLAAVVAAVIARRRPLRSSTADSSPATTGASAPDAAGASEPSAASASWPAAASASMRIRRLPIINATTCLGCDACVEACPYDVLEVRRYVAVVARPDACCGLTLCAQVCPNQSLTMQDVGPAEAPAIERVELEAVEHPGVFVVGDAGGGSLIRNAIDEGARAVAIIAERLARAPRARTPRTTVPADPDVLDVLVIGAGPAGLSAALEAQARGLRALTVEQHTVAGSIQSFPRGKLVLDAARAAATSSRLWLAEATKEELLARWMLAVRTERPPILEGQRVTALHRESDGTWTVDLAAAAPRRARTIILAVGRRGSPRRLAVDVAPAMLPHVHYALADAASFANRRVVIVGLGDVAIEAAIALSRQRGTTVTIAHRGDDFRRGRARNLDELRRRVAAGAVRIAWRAEVRAVAPGRVELATPAGRVDEPCDSLFVLIGAEPGSDLLSRLTRPVQPAQTDAAHHAFAPVGPVQHPGDRGEEAPP